MSQGPAKSVPGSLNIQTLYKSLLNEAHVMSEDELRFWANAHAPAGSTVALAVLRLFGKLDAHQVGSPTPSPVLDRALEESVARAYKKLIGTKDDFDGSTGTPEDGKAGHPAPVPPGQQ